MCRAERPGSSLGWPLTFYQEISPFTIPVHSHFLPFCGLLTSRAYVDQRNKVRKGFHSFKKSFNFDQRSRLVKKAYKMIILKFWNINSRDNPSADLPRAVLAVSSDDTKFLSASGELPLLVNLTFYWLLLHFISNK